MALVIKDRVQETTTTTGTGTITLAGAVSGFQSFSVIGNSNTTFYSIVGGTEWELGIGTYTSSGTTLSRDTILESSNGGTAVNFSAGTKTVFCTYPAERSVYVDGSSIVPGATATLPISSGGTGSSTAAFSGANITDLNATAITAGTISNARTTASSSNGASTIVERDATGNFTANVITANGSSITSINAANISSGTLGVARGGTGAATLDANNVILGNGTSAVQFVAPGTSSNVLTSNGTTWVSQAAGGGGGGTPTVQTYDSGTSATWTKPGSANWVLIEIWGGGGSGGRAAASQGAGGGGGGAYNSALIPFANLQGAVTYTVGAGGASRTTSGSGNVGGNSQVDMATFAGGGTKTLFAYGGGGGGGSGSTGGAGGGGGGQLGAGQVGATSTTSSRSDASITAFGGTGGGPGGGLGTRTQGALSCPATIGTAFLAGNGSSGGGGGGLGINQTVGMALINLVNSASQGAGSIYGGGGGGGGGGLSSTSATVNNGGSSLYGGGGGGGSNFTTTAGNGGDSVWGGAGSAGTTATTASSAGTLPAGGSGGTENANSGAGGGGRVRFTYW